MTLPDRIKEARIACKHGKWEKHEWGDPHWIPRYGGTDPYGWCDGGETIWILDGTLVNKCEVGELIPIVGDETFLFCAIDKGEGSYDYCTNCNGKGYTT